MTYPNIQLFIDGQWCDAQSGRTMPVFNPATGTEIGRLAHAGIPDLERAVAAAQKGFEVWRDVPAHERSAILANAPHVSIIGGAEIYRLFLPRADRIEVTEVHIAAQGDTILEPFGADWLEVAREAHPAEGGRPAYDFVTLKRRG